MYNKILLAVLLCVVAQTIRINHLQVNYPIAGGWSPIDINNLSQDQKAVDSYIRQNNQIYQKSKLIKGEQQVVAGQNYKFTYKE